MKKLVLKMMAVCAGALIVSCGSGKNMLSVSSLDGNGILQRWMDRRYLQRECLSLVLM